MRAALAALLAMSCLPGLDEAWQLFDPRPTPPAIAWRASAELRVIAEADDRERPGSLALDREALGLGWLAARGERDELWLHARAARTALRGDARLPSGIDPSGVYHEAAAGATWKRLASGGDVYGLAAAASVLGQPPLFADDGWGGSATAFARLGLGEEGRDGLLLALHYDSERALWRDIPLLPLLAWQGQRGSWSLVLGVPFTMVAWRDEQWRIAAVLGPTPSASVARRLSGPWFLVADGRWARWQGRRDGRPEDEARLQLSQWEWSGGLRWTVAPPILAELLLGAATARRLGEDDDADDARRDGLRWEAAPFAVLRGRVVW
ncbi:MAG: hypothetical protein N3B15_04610 [Planctomycetota bacterium]|nr:hypothetical protein [Planctomycetota bacterium]